ncbi:hypothetical protein MUP77_13590 [Candidatus Bathyarchaeota archaeon]|nr:hypothetical protein [Candidatus Bathyarchaeota archaeon]
MSGYSDEELKKMMRAAVREELASQKPEQPVESHADHVSACPDCLSGAMEKLNKTSDYVCEGCGFPLGDEAFMKKLKSCPNCGKTKPMKRR